MSRSFEGFLLDYCRELTNLETSSLKKFFLAVTADSPRAGEPLLLLAFSQHRENFLMRAVEGTSWEAPYSAFLEDYKNSQLSLTDFLEALPEGNRFKKAYQAWVSESGQLDRDRAVLSNVARSLSYLIDEKGLTRAEACRLLNVDKGNFYAFLKGDSARFSRETAVAAYRKLLTM